MSHFSFHFSFHSLKAKFVAAFGSLIVLLFVGLGAFLVDAKGRELSGDIAQQTQAFARLSVSKVVEDYKLYLLPGNFVQFSRQMNAILRQNTDIESLSVVSYNGVIFYDSSDEFEEQYSGTIRTVSDPLDLERVQAQHLGLEMSDGRTVYVKVDDEGLVTYVNFNEDSVPAPLNKDRILSITVPYDNAYAVIYRVTYDALLERLASARLQIIIVGITGLILTLMLSYMLSVSVTNPLKKLKEGALRIATGDFKTRVDIRSKDEVGVLGETFNKMAVDLERSTQALVYKERVAKELELAAHIQNQLLPKEKLVLPKMDMSGGLIPATEVGGDAFDFIPMGNGKTLAYLGDVTGHGVAAGIVSSIANAILYGFRGRVDLFQIIEDLNDILREKTSVNLFMTMALLLWDENGDRLTYVNAGHPPILYYDSAQRKVVDIRIPGMALRMVEDLQKIIQKHEIVLKPNDVVVAYSDGIPEAVDLKAQQYGLQRLKRIVQDAADDFYSADAIKNAILADVKEYIGGGTQLDDITVLVLKRKA